jgi:hypothetical protein
MSGNGGRQLHPLLLKARKVALVLLLASVPLAGFVGFGVPGTEHQKQTATLALFDVLIWLSLALVVVCRWLRGGWPGVLGLARAVPVAAWFLVGLGLWSGLIWPRCAGDLEPLPMTAVAKGLLPLVEYGVLAFAVVEELAAEEGPRRAGLLALAVSSGAALAYGAIQYFGSCPAFEVGSFLGAPRPFAGGDRNALGAFLAVAVPFFAVVAAGSGAWRWRALCGLLAAAGALLATSGGAVLGIACGVLLGAVLLGPARGSLVAGGLVLLLLLGQFLPRGNLTTALESVRVDRSCPRDAPQLGFRKGDPLLALRYVRAGNELNVLRVPFRAEEARPALFFGLGPGGYDRTKGYRMSLADRPAGQTDVHGNHDVLANEPHTFNLFGVAAAELGLLGLVGFVWFFACCAARCARAHLLAAEGSPERVLALAAMAAVAGGVVASPLSSVWIRGSGPLLVTLVAIACSARAKHVKTADQ